MTDQDFNFDLPDDVSAVDINFTSYVTPPVATVQLNWWNGDPRAAKGSFMYFGGWYCSEEYFLPAIALMGLDHAPGFEKCDLVNKEGQTFPAYVSRSIAVATVTTRKAWFPKNNGNGKYSKSEVLAVAANLTETGFNPWGYVVLSASGYSAKYIEDAITLWQRQSATVRMKETATEANRSGLPASLFYCILGTFGDEIISQKATSTATGKSSTITPCQLREPKTYDRKMLMTTYVGKEKAREMINVATMSSDWVADIRTQAKRAEEAIKTKATTEYAAQGGFQKAGDDDDYMSPPPPPSFDDEESIF